MKTHFEIATLFIDYFFTPFYIHYTNGSRSFAKVGTLIIRFEVFHTNN